jgi:hypothetical protein
LHQQEAEEARIDELKVPERHAVMNALPTLVKVISVKHKLVIAVNIKLCSHLGVSKLQVFDMVEVNILHLWWLLDID